jgi:DNA-binding response OmpR family regulator
MEGIADRVRIGVRDFGPGIPEEFKPRMFTRFAQADSGNTRRSQGTGLGLSIVKAIVERHGGMLDFESPLPDRGTRFWFTLPLIKDDRGDGRIDDHRPGVLICDGDPSMVSMIASTIERDGWRCRVASTAEEAQAQLAETRFAAMTVDLGLAAMSGLELIRHVRRDERHHMMPIIAISSSPSQRQQELGKEDRRIVHWLKKPVGEEELRQTLAEAVNVSGDRNILHVEDEPDMVTIVREIVAEILGAGAHMEVASSVAAAREMLEQRRFDLVILDVHLPDGNGLDLVPLLRTTNSHAALLILSADDVLGRGYAMIQANVTKARMDNSHLAETISRLLAEARKSTPKEFQDGHRATEQDPLR